MQIDVRGWPGRSKGVPGAPGPPRSPKSRISGRSKNHIFQTQVSTDGYQGGDNGGVRRSPLASREGREGNISIQNRSLLTGYLKAVWLKIFGPVFRGFRPEIEPGTPPRSPGLARDINLHQKSTPETNSKAISWHPKVPARLPSGTQEGFF